MSAVLYYVCILMVTTVVSGGEDKVAHNGLLTDPWLAVFAAKQNVEVEEGSAAELECSAEATPVAVVHWLFNGKRITVGDHEDESNLFEKVINDGVRTLQDSITRSRVKVGCVNKNTVGRYECVASNGYLTKSANVTVSVTKKSNNDGQTACNRKRYDVSFVAKPAEIYMWTDSRLERTGVSVQLMCRSKGNPNPRVTWYEYKTDQSESNEATEMEEIKDNDQYQILQNGDLLTRTPANPVEGGTVYKCVASNPWGQDTATIALNWPAVSDKDDV